VPGFGVRSEVSENGAADRHHFHGALAEVDGQSRDVVGAQTLFPFLEVERFKVEQFRGARVR
jgi:hypothetical protein